MNGCDRYVKVLLDGFEISQTVEIKEKEATNKLIFQCAKTGEKTSIDISEETFNHLSDFIDNLLQHRDFNRSYDGKEQD